MMKKIILPLLIIVCFLSGCAAKSGGGQITTGEIGVIKDDDYGGTYIDESIDAFLDLGFEFGDSVNVAFDNGNSFEDIPFYSGYYCPPDGLLLCGYPGYEHVVFARSYGDSTWEEFHMTPSTRVTVTLNEKGKYAQTQEINNLQYSDNRNDYPSDEAFANYREVNGGDLAPGLLYRSASPCDNSHNRAPYANALAEKDGMRFVLNLSDDEEEYEEEKSLPDFSSSYYDKLYQDGKVLFLNLTANYRSDDFAETLSNALLSMTESDGPCLIHCVEGKDRTGFACVLLLALAGADYDEMLSDYMISFSNYYGITKESQPERYDAISETADDFLYFLCGAQTGTPMETLDFEEGAEDFLRQGGLSDDEIQKISSFIRSGSL